MASKFKIPKKNKDTLAKKAVKVKKNELTKKIEKEFNEVKKEFIEEFLSHPVTLEILAGPKDRQRVSGTLGGKANLFSFIGFNAGDDPIAPILELLQNTSIQKTERGWSITIPTAQDIFAVTPMPWATGRSWARGIEAGIPGLGRLLNKSWPTSRSGKAIQVKKKTRDGKFSNTKYISSLINKYKKRFKKIKLP